MAAKDAHAEQTLQNYVKLMTEHQGNLRAFIVSLMPGSPDVADVLQETNAALWEKREQFEPGSNFIAWSFQIARFEVCRQRDRTKRLRRIVFSDEALALLAEVEAPAETEDQLLSALDACLQKLSPKQRELVRQRYTPGLSLESHAEEIGRSPGSLRVALLRIRESLKNCIETAQAQRPA